MNCCLSYTAFIFIIDKYYGLRRLELLPGETVFFSFAVIVVGRQILYASQSGVFQLPC